MRTLLSWTAFAAAVYAFSALWGAFRGAWEGRPTVPPGAFLVLAATFMLSLTYLAFILYAADRAAGKVRRRIGLFERFLERRPHA